MRAGLEPTDDPNCYSGAAATAGAAEVCLHAKLAPAHDSGAGGRGRGKGRRSNRSKPRDPAHEGWEYLAPFLAVLVALPVVAWLWGWGKQPGVARGLGWRSIAAQAEAVEMAAAAAAAARGGGGGGGGGGKADLRRQQRQQLAAEAAEARAAGNAWGISLEGSGAMGAAAGRGRGPGGTAAGRRPTAG